MCVCVCVHLSVCVSQEHWFLQSFITSTSDPREWAKLVEITVELRNRINELSAFLLYIQVTESFCCQNVAICCAASKENDTRYHSEDQQIG